MSDLKEKFLVVLEIETNHLAGTLAMVRTNLNTMIPDLEGSGWIVTGVLIDDVKDILKERGTNV